MDGKRNLTHRNVRKFAIGLGLTGKEQVYFENLVFFNQSEDPAEQEFLKKNLELAKSHDDRALLTKDQYDILANWYPLAIKELLLLNGFPPVPKKIAARFDHRFTPQQARDALTLLERLGFIEVDAKTGSTKVIKQHLATPDLAQSDAVARFHHTVIEMVKAAIDGQTSKERCLSALTVAIRRSDLPEAFRKIHEFRNEMDTFFSKGKPYDSVYQLNISLFRLDCDVD